MPEVTARVEKIQNKQAKNGDVYTTISLNGQKKVFFDWEGHCEAAGISKGDTVRIEHDGSNFPRVTKMEKAVASEPLDKENSENELQENKDKHTVRICALECAARVLQGTGQTATEITTIAERLERWLTR